MALDPTLAWKGVQIAAVAVFAGYSVRKRMLTAAGALVALTMGAAIVLATNLLWLLLLFALLGLASLSTRFRFEEKQRRSVAEKRGGARRVRNVVANGLTPTLVALAAPAIASQWGLQVAAVAFASGIAVSSADTVASEIGSLADRVVLITTLKPVPPGTDGGISLRGQLASLCGAFSTALVALLFLGILEPMVYGPPASFPVTLPAFLIVTLTGFVGCQVDSLLGATLEGGGLVTKEEVNAAAITTGAALGFVLAILLL